MVWMMVLQLFTGWGVKEVSAEGGIPAIKFTVNYAAIYSAEDCAQVDSVDAWAIPYEIVVDLAAGNTVYLSVESTQTGGSPVTLVAGISLTGTNLTWGVGGSGSDQVAVQFAESGAAKGKVYLKKPDAQAEYTITISVKDATDAVIASKEVTVTYITEINAPTVALDLDSSLAASVVEAAENESVSGTWTNQDVTFNIKVQDAVVGLKSITYELDDVLQTDKNKSYLDGSYEKSEVQQSFTVSTGASIAKGHKLVVTAVNARGKKTTFTRYILVDKDAPGIALTIKETGSAVEDNKVYGNPVTMAAAVTESLSATGMVVTYKVEKDGGSEVASTVTASSSGTYEKEFTEDGIYEVSVVAVDGAGNSFETTPVTFTVDGTKPVITQTSPQENGKYYNADQTFQYKVTDANLAGGQVSGKIQRTLNGVTSTEQTIAQTCTGNEVSDSHTCDKEGAYQITVNAKDAAGNSAAAAHEIGFVVDKTSPVLGILAKDTADQTVTTGGKTKKNVKVTYQVTDRNHQFDQYKITVKRTDAAGRVSNDTQRVASANWTLSSNDTSKQNNITADTTVEYSEEGSYEITFEGADAAGNVGTSQTISFVIDHTKPVISGVSYTTNQVAITPKYGIIFGNQIIQVNFTVEDALTGLKTDKPVLVTIGTAEERDNTPIPYPAQHVSGSSYYVQLPLKTVADFDDKITIWAYDQVENEQSFESERTIYNTNSSTIAMTCTTGNEGVWTKENVTYRTRVTDTKCGIRSITYKKIEKVNGTDQSTEVYKVDFDQQLAAGTITAPVTEYQYDFTATDTALTGDGYKLQLKVVNNCGTTTTMEKTVYVDKVKPVVELSGVDNGSHYKTSQRIGTKVTDVSYSGTKTKYYVTCQYDGQSVTIPWDDFASTQYTDTTYKNLSAEGNYEIYAETTDSVGLTTRSNTLQFTIDKQAPVIESVKVVKGLLKTEQNMDADDNYYVEDDAQLDVVATDHFPTEDASVWIKGTHSSATVPEESHAMTTSPLIFTSNTYSVEGRYVLTVGGKDKAGNPAVNVNKAVVVDKTAPELSIHGISNGEMTKDPVTLTYQAVDKNHDFDRYKVTVHRTTLDGVNETTVEQNAVNWRQTGYNRNEQVDYTTTRQSVYSEEGNYEITFEGKDKAGNVAVTKSISFSIDHTAPVIKDVTYTVAGELIGPKYGIIFNKRAIRVSFTVKDSVVGLKDRDAVLVTVGKKTDRNNGTKLYPAASLQGETYCVTIPLEDVYHFDNTITIWAYDKLFNEAAVESVRTIFNTYKPDISMECTTDNDGVWTNGDVTYHTVVTDRRCGISKITYTKIETVGGVERRDVVKEVDFEQQRLQGQLSSFVTEYAYDFTATETAKTVDGYILRVDVTNNCDVSTFMEKKVYIDKVAPEVTLSGTENGAHYNTDQTIHTVVKDLSYRNTKTQYYVTCQYDGQNVNVTWADFLSANYTSETDKVVSAEGTYKIYAVTTDSAGNQTTSNTLRFTVDKEAPVIAEARVIKGIHETEQPVNEDGIYYVNEDGRLAVKVTDHFPSPDGHVYVEGKLKDTVMQQERYVMDSSPFSFVTQTPYTEEGKYTVTVGGKDKANNTAVNVYRDIVVDKTSPQLTISGIAQGQMTREPVTLTYQSVDKNHDFEQYRVTVRRTTLDGVDETLVEQNAADWKQTGYDRNRQENYTTTRTSMYKEEGNYQVTFEGTDKAGNVATVKTISFSIDHTAPVISDISYSDPSGLLTPKYQTIFSNQVIQVKFRVEDRVVGIEDSLVYVTLGTAQERLNGAPMYIANKDLDGYYHVNVPSDLAVAEYDGALSIWANDRLKNESGAETVRIIQNADKPEIVMDCDLDYTKWQSRNVTFHTKVSDQKSGLKEVKYTIDGKEVKTVTFTEFVKEYSYDLTATKTADKVTGYSMTIEVTNNNGTGSFAKRQVYVDKKAPSVQLSGIQNGTYYNQNQKITANVGDVSFKNTKTQYYVERTLDGKTYTDNVPSFTLKKYAGKCIRTFHKEGRYKVYAVTTDSAGNRTRSNTLRFVIDKTSPKLAISGVQDGSMNGTDVEVQFDLTDSFYSTTDSLIRIEKTIDGTTTSEEKKDFPKTGKHSTWNRTFSEDGTYQITFTAKDKAGNVAKTQTISFSVDKTQPVIEITGTSNYQQWDKPVTVRFSVEESYYTGDQITIRGTRQDINGKKEELEFTTFANTAKVSSMTQLFNKDGIYDLVLQAKDEAGNEDRKEIHFVLDQTKPEVHKVGNYNGGYYQEFRIADTLADVFKDLTVVSYRILLNGVEYDGTTPVTDEGKYNLSVEVEDELGHKNRETAEFIIDHTAPKVIFTGVKDGQAVTERGKVILSLTNPEDEITGVSMNGTEYDADTRELEYSEYGFYKINVDCVDKAGNKVTRMLRFTYHNPLTTTILFAIMGGLIVITCIWLWVRTMKKEKEEEKL